MSQRIQSAITNVNKLLKAKSSASTKATSASVIAATRGKRTKILAMLGVGSKPNLRLLNKLINRGVITGQEVVDAVGEALMLRRVNKRIVEAIMTALHEAIGDASADVIDVEDAA